MTTMQRTQWPQVRTALVALVTGSLLTLTSPVRADDPAVGQWWTPGFSSRVELATCPKGLCGRIVWLWDTRSANSGQTVLSGFSKEADGHWTGGQAFNPADGNTYRASLKLLDNTRLRVTGCVLVFCQEQLWRRVGSVAVVPASVLPNK